MRAAEACAPAAVEARNIGTRDGSGHARLSIVVESSALTSDRESDLANPHVTDGEVEPEFSPLEPKPPGQLREVNPEQVSLTEWEERGETRQPPLCSPVWRRAFADVASGISIVHAVQSVREGMFTLASSFREMVVGSLMKATMPCLQRGQGMHPGGLEVATAMVLVEQR